MTIEEIVKRLEELEDAISEETEEHAFESSYMFSLIDQLIAELRTKGVH